MPDHYDSLETRPPALRDSEESAVLPKIVARAMQAPGWAKHLAGIDAHAVNSRSGLAKLPVLRKSDIAALQKEHPPFGGLNVTPPGKARRLLMSEPGDVASVAHRVGYESPSQFSREYSRQFGAPPSRDLEQLRRSLGVAAPA